MQGKGFIKFFLVAFAVVSVIQLSLMIPTWNVERKADNFATSKCPQGEGTACFRLSRASYLDSISSETIFSIPFLKKYTYPELKGSQLGFGLDLKGGMSVLLQVDLRDFIRAMAGARRTNRWKTPSQRPTNFKRTHAPIISRCLRKRGKKLRAASS